MIKNFEHAVVVTRKSMRRKHQDADDIRIPKAARRYSKRVAQTAPPTERAWQEMQMNRRIHRRAFADHIAYYQNYNPNA